jgi:hypothetical protein
MALTSLPTNNPLESMNPNDTEARRYFDFRLQAVRDALSDAEKQDELANDCLAIAATITLTIQLSTGGGADGFEIICDATTGEPVHGQHYYTIWGYSRECPLTTDELADVCAAYAIEDGRQFLKRL